MMYFRDNLGWPVQTIRGRPVFNFLRYLLHTDIWMTLRLRNHPACPKYRAVPDNNETKTET